MRNYTVALQKERVHRKHHHRRAIAIDPTSQARARVDAFLHVPLFRQIYDEYKGHTLPPSTGIEATMERLGVSPKQTDRARQALQRSAERAGFFGNGRDRLVTPALAESDPADSNGAGGEEKPIVITGGGSSDPVQAAWHRLLEEGEDWPAEKVKQYVDAARIMARLG